MGDRARRLILCSVVIAALAGATFASRLTTSKDAFAAPLLAPVAAGASAVASGDVASSAWYCVAGAPATLIFTSSSTRTVTGTVQQAGHVERNISIPPGGQVTLPPEARASGAQGAKVLLHGGAVAVSESVHEVLGWSFTQCASSTSNTWYFPQGSTVAGNTVSLDVFDPSVTSAVVDIGLLTASGETQPADYQGVSVPAGGLLTAKLDQHATGDPVVGTIVTVLSGSVVADELDEMDVGRVFGFADQLGAPQLHTAWEFPYSVEPKGGSLAFNVVNPGTIRSRVVVNATFGAGTSVHPVVVSVPGHSTVSLNVAHHPGFEANTPYSVEVTSSTPVVVGRTIRGTGKPKPNAGAVIGIPEGADSWLVPAVPAPGRPLSLALTALGSKPVKVKVMRAIGGEPLIPGKGGVTVVAPRELARLAQSLLADYSGPILIMATGPIAVELDAQPAASAGTVVVPAFVAP